MTEKFEGKIPETERVPEKVKAILDWLGNKTMWASSNSLDKNAVDAPEGITKEDVREAFLRFESRGAPMAPHELRGYYITALAHRVLGEQIEKWRAEHPNASEKELQQFINTDVKIELIHPETGKYSFDKFRQVGHGWERGTLILKGNFGENVASGMRGGKVIVEGNTGPSAGSLMSGGELEINGIADYDLGFGMTDGHIHARKAAPGIGYRMDGGLIEIDEPIDLKQPGLNNVVGDDPWIGVEKKGGRIIIEEKEY